MLLGVAVIELQLPGARTEKDRRRIVRSLVDRIHARCRVSVAETELAEFPQRAELGVAIVHASEAELERLLDEVREVAERDSDAFVTAWRPEIIEVMP
jgi:uncharacterized protein YlxP (DUF503 family)